MTTLDGWGMPCVLGRMNNSIMGHKTSSIMGRTTGIMGHTTGVMGLLTGGNIVKMPNGPQRFIIKWKIKNRKGVGRGAGGSIVVAMTRVGGRTRVNRMTNCGLRAIQLDDCSYCNECDKKVKHCVMCQRQPLTVSWNFKF